MTDRQGGASVPDVSLPDFFGLPTSPITFDSDPHVIYDSLHGRWLATEVSWDCDPGGGGLFGTRLHRLRDLADDPTRPASGTSGPSSSTTPCRTTRRRARRPTRSGSAATCSRPTRSRRAPATASTSSSLSAGTDTVYLDWADLANGGGVRHRSNCSCRRIRSSPTRSPHASRSRRRRRARRSTRSSARRRRRRAWTSSPDDQGSVVAGTTAHLDATWDLTADSLLAADSGPAPADPARARTRSTQAIDFRATDAIWQGDRLVFVATYPCMPVGDSTTRDCVRVTELDTTGVSPTVEPTVTQDFLIGESGKDLFMGGVGLAGDGTLHVGWTRSSSSDSPVVLHRPPGARRRAELDQRAGAPRRRQRRLRRRALGRLRRDRPGSAGPEPGLERQRVLRAGPTG